MRFLNKICLIAYEIGIIGTFLLAVLAPLHGQFTKHFDLIQTIDETHVKIAGDVSTIPEEAALNIYRFHYDWKAKLGVAYLQSKTDNEAVISFDPKQMAWPIGVQSRVSVAPDGRFFLTVGSDQGVEVGDSFNIFENKNRLGNADVSAVEKQRAFLSSTDFLKNLKLDNLVAENYTIATQATYFQSQTMYRVELLLIFGVFFIYFMVFVATKKSPVILLTAWLKNRIKLPRKLLFWVINMLVAIPFIWFMSNMPMRLIFFVMQKVLGVYVNGEAVISGFVPYLYSLGALAYFYYLFGKHKSPILAFWHLISYKKPLDGKNNSLKRGIFIWVLYMIIVYAFASILLRFLKGDLAAMRQIGWPAPSREAAFEFIKFGVWSLTVVGCLIGYGHSVISILWKKYARNLDFSVVGWLTNGFCYPLFGVIIWQMIPSFTGVDPIITDGPLQSLMFFLGVWLNVFYMITIWNLGLMFGLMADKGVRKSGFYSVVRHPSYTLEVQMFFVTEIAGLTTGTEWLVISMYFFLYWIRSEREDNFMSYSNPEYVEYKKEAEYKFIPGVY
ncbi:hypothetical protein HZA40_04785 [Candidatus Peregrinibacteria bacterium]|nr:hypothetical protein [Candidatus Peregrinibacteria bacterium]